MNDTQPTRQEREQVYSPRMHAPVAKLVRQMVAEVRESDKEEDSRLIHCYAQAFCLEVIAALNLDPLTSLTASAPGEHWLEQSRLATEAYAHFQGAVRAELDRIGLPIHAADGHRMMELERLALLGAPGERRTRLEEALLQLAISAAEIGCGNIIGLQNLAAEYAWSLAALRTDPLEERKPNYCEDPSCYYFGSTHSHTPSERKYVPIYDRKTRDKNNTP